MVRTAPANAELDRGIDQKWRLKVLFAQRPAPDGPSPSVTDRCCCHGIEQVCDYLRDGFMRGPIYIVIGTRQS